MTIGCIPVPDSGCIDLFTMNMTMIASIYSYPMPR